MPHSRSSGAIVGLEEKFATTIRASRVGTPTCTYPRLNQTGISILIVDVRFWLFSSDIFGINLFTKLVIGSTDFGRQGFSRRQGFPDDSLLLIGRLFLSFE
jgi:hypothetical protein